MNQNLQGLSASGFWDKTGAAVSWLCAVHCLAAPFAVAVLPLAGLGCFASEEVEYFLIGLSVVIASITLLPGFFRFHRRATTLLLFVTGIGFVASADALFEKNLLSRLLFVLTGAGLITASHILNRRLCQKCLRCAETGCRSLP